MANSIARTRSEAVIPGGGWWSAPSAAQSIGGAVM
jgi:hypothetical protein